MDVADVSSEDQRDYHGGSGPLRGPFAMEPEPRNNRFSHSNFVLLLALNRARGVPNRCAAPIIT